MGKNSLFIAVCLSMLAASGCYYDKEDELYEYYYRAHQCQTDSLSYSADIEPIVRGHCATTGCHVAGGSGNGIFENYAGVKTKVDNGSLLTRISVTKDMPPSGPLNSCQVSQIEAWILAGAPQN